MTEAELKVTPLDAAGSPYAKVADGDYSGLVQFYPGADEAVKAGQEFAQGNYASGVIALAGAGTEVALMVLDPIGTLASSVAGFLLDYMPPLPQMLDVLAGNPGMVEGIAQTWTSVAGAMNSSAADYEAALATVLGTWTGRAADVYQVAATALIDAMYKAANVCECFGMGLEVLSGVVEAVRSFTKEIIAELVGQLISWAAQVAATLGLGASWVIPMATARIAITVKDASLVAQLLVETFVKAETVREQIILHLDQLFTAIGIAIESWNRGQA
jgi:acid phosphatase family membrane protein YuiD